MPWIDHSLTIPCPVCEAIGGEPCVLTDGRPALESHVERWGLAIDSGVKLTDLFDLLHHIECHGLDVSPNREPTSYN
jgi:hypothetical protein